MIKGGKDVDKGSKCGNKGSEECWYKEVWVLMINGDKELMVKRGKGGIVLMIQGGLGILISLAVY